MHETAAHLYLYNIKQEQINKFNDPFKSIYNETNVGRHYSADFHSRKVPLTIIESFHSLHIIKTNWTKSLKRLMFNNNIKQHYSLVLKSSRVNLKKYFIKSILFPLTCSLLKLFLNITTTATNTSVGPYGTRSLNFHKNSK